MILESYNQIGGVHPETAALTNVLASQGVVAPHTNEPFSEAMILGIAGGLGCGYILWEFKKYDSAILVMGFQNRWNYPTEFMQNLCDRLGVASEFRTTGGKKKAAADLLDALAAERPAIAWVDQQSLPYFYMRPLYNGCFGHFVTVFGLEDDQFLLDDRSKKPIKVASSEFIQARARIGSYKNRLLLLTAPSGQIDLEKAVYDGLADCIDYLGRDSQTFAIPVYRKWARLMTDTRNKKGWPTVFKNQNGLYSTLRSIFEGVELFGTGGGGLRRIYADFLDEASLVLDNDNLKHAAGEYRKLSDLWSSFAMSVLPDSILPMADTRRLLSKKYELYIEIGADGNDALQQTSQSLIDLEEELNSHLSLSEQERQELFGTMQENLFELYEAELKALESLREAVN